VKLESLENLNSVMRIKILSYVNMCNMLRKILVDCLCSSVTSNGSNPFRGTMSYSTDSSLIINVNFINQLR